MKSKESLVKELVAIISSNFRSVGQEQSPEELARLTRHNMGRSVTDLKESIDRWYAIQATTQAEINLHCQPYRMRGI